MRCSTSASTPRCAAETPLDGARPRFSAGIRSICNGQQREGTTMARQTHIYVGAQQGRGGKQNGVFRLAIGEDRWSKLAGGLPDDANIPAITLHPENPDVIYVGTHDGPYRSTDRGDHWERLGFPDRGVEVWS